MVRDGIDFASFANTPPSPFLCPVNIQPVICIMMTGIAYDTIVHLVLRHRKTQVDGATQSPLHRSRTTTQRCARAYE